MSDKTDDSALSNAPIVPVVDAPDSESDDTSATDMQTQAAQPAPEVPDGDAAALAYSETGEASVEDNLASGRRPWPSAIRWAAILLFVTAVAAAGIVTIGVAD